MKGGAPPCSLLVFSARKLFVSWISARMEPAGERTTGYPPRNEGCVFLKNQRIGTEKRGAPNFSYQAFNCHTAGRRREAAVVALPQPFSQYGETRRDIHLASCPIPLESPGKFGAAHTLFMWSSLKGLQSSQFDPEVIEIFIECTLRHRHSALFC